MGSGATINTTVQQARVGSEVDFPPAAYRLTLVPKHKRLPACLIPPEKHQRKKSGTPLVVCYRQALDSYSCSDASVYAKVGCVHVYGKTS